MGILAAPSSSSVGCFLWIFWSVLQSDSSIYSGTADETAEICLQLKNWVLGIKERGKLGRPWDLLVLVVGLMNLVMAATRERLKLREALHLPIYWTGWWLWLFLSLVLEADKGPIFSLLFLSILDPTNFSLLCRPPFL